MTLVLENGIKRDPEDEWEYYWDDYALIIPEEAATLNKEEAVCDEGGGSFLVSCNY